MSEKVLRKFNFQNAKDRREVRNIRMTDEEIRDLKRMTMKLGFEKCRDTIAYLTQYGSKSERTELMRKANEYDQMKIDLCSLTTKCNEYREFFQYKHDLNEDLQLEKEFLINGIIRGVEKLWQDYK